jgi:hypothetical protein
MSSEIVLRSSSSEMGEASTSGCQPQLLVGKMYCMEILDNSCFNVSFSMCLGRFGNGFGEV